VMLFDVLSKNRSFVCKVGELLDDAEPAFSPHPERISTAVKIKVMKNNAFFISLLFPYILHYRCVFREYAFLGNKNSSC